jgi:hypothetical protein
MTDIECSENRLLRQQLRDANHEIEVRDHAIERVAREKEYWQRRAMKFDDNERPEFLAQTLMENQPYYTRKDWQRVNEEILRRLSETRP